MPLLPYVRREIFLQAIKNRDASALPDPNNREELFLKAIAEDVALIPSGVSVVLPAAVSEMLANLPEAHTHTELFYKEILDTILIATTITDTTPYISRETAGGLPVSGTAELNKKLGNTVCVNQLLPRNTFSDTQSGVTLSINADGLVTISGESTAQSGYINFSATSIAARLIESHKYLILPVMITDVGQTTMSVVALLHGNNGSIADYGKKAVITTQTVAVTGPSYLYIRPLYSFNGTLQYYIYVIDLTLWFGSNDRIPSDILSHPENWGRYYAGSLDYAAGYLDSADGSVLKSKGADGTTVLAEVDTGSEVLRSAGTAADEKTPDGMITRRIGVVDLGTLTWEKQGSQFRCSLPSIKLIPNATVANIACAKYTAVSTTVIMSTSPDKVIAARDVSIGGLRVYDTAYSSGDAAAFKTAMSGVMVYYELATPTTEQGSLFDPTYGVEYGGTESWTNLKGIPQGHETEYKEYTT